MRRAVALMVAAACGGAERGDRGVANRGGVPGPPAGAWACPAGDEVAVDLDGDGRDDLVRLAPSAAAVTCLEVHASTAPPLACDAASPPQLELLERDDGRYQSIGVTACDPMGAQVWTIVAPPPGAPVPPRSKAALLAEAAPTGTALWLDGGDASAALTWHDRRWTWVAIGY